MSIYLGKSGQNLTIKPIAGPNERQDKQKIMGLKIQKIPIYKADTFLYYEVSLDNLPLIYSTWSDSEVVVDLKAKEWIDRFKYNKIALADLPKSNLTILPLDSWGHDLKWYQKEFAEIDHNKENIGLILDTGSGKLATVLLRALNLGCKRILTFTTKNNFDDWIRDSRNIFGLNCIEYRGTKQQRSKIDLNNGDIIVSNYEQAKEIKERIEEGTFDAIIMDEADDAANPTTIAHKELQLIKNKLKRRKCTIACTATPFEDRLEPLWGLIALIDKSVAGKRDEFLARFQEPVAWKTLPTGRSDGSTYEKPVKFKTKNLKDLRDLMSTIFYRVNVSVSFKFKEHTDIIAVDMTEKQWDRYREVQEEIEYLYSTGDLFKGNPLPKFNELFAITEGLWEDQTYSGKFDVICDKVRSSNMKGIVWSAFVEPIKRYHEVFKDRAVIWHGTRTPNQKKLAKLAFQGASDKFEEEEFYRLLDKDKDFPFKKPGEAQWLMSTTSLKGGRGSNYSKAQIQLYSSINVSGKATKQSMGRNKRANTTHSDIYYNFYAVDNTIDIRYLTRVQEKIKKMGLILDGDSDITMSGRDLYRLLKDKKELGLR